jgi:two-component system CheB/CheR fusion protein
VADPSKQSCGRKQAVAGECNARSIVIVIGAPPGGMPPLQDLTAALTPSTDVAFIVIVQLDPGHGSELPHIIDAGTAMPAIRLKGANDHWPTVFM